MSAPILPFLTSHLPYDFQSLLPRQSAPTSPSPEISSKAPSLQDLDYSSSQAWIISFVRHPGCPFAEKETRDLAKIQEKFGDRLKVVIVQHAEGEELKKWSETVGLSNSSISLISSPDRSLYRQFGLASMPYSGLFSTSMISALKQLKSQGIVNTKTGSSSDRWQNSGSFAIDGNGVVKWKHVAEHAGDTCDYEKAVERLGLQTG